ncbi:alpha-tubulin N-acetyltransferase 1-like isoform X2 [Halichondria panicea]|uniref:alpha-tubulin N-acetyltransferase 1-like isoform X2 n=1 Tax=Halichondria panicea TaxID=6063 RepID=UPI00312B773B
MEFPFDVQSLLPGEITRLVGEKLPHTLSSSRKTSSHDDQLAIIVNEMGIASAKAQGLRLPITTYDKLVASNHILYITSDNGGQRGSVIGILKLGLKRLFLTDRVGVVHEVEPLCVLDFYVHESRQRSGCGKRLFEELLKAENVKPYEVAIDRPSPKFLGFLKKHYQLASFVSQANNYVVFDQFFSTCKGTVNTNHHGPVWHIPTIVISHTNFSWINFLSLSLRHGATVSKVFPLLCC